MRDAFGGIFMIRLMLVFIVIYVAFAALSLNYAKAFKIKNSVISYIEENDIQDFGALFNSGESNKLNGLAEILDSYHYGVSCPDGKEGLINGNDHLAPKRYCYHGVIIEEKTNTVIDGNKSNEIIKYDVSTFASWNLNFMNRILMLSGQNPNAKDVINGSWEINGEATVVKRNEPNKTNGTNSNVTSINDGIEYDIDDTSSTSPNTNTTSQNSTNNNTSSIFNKCVDSEVAIYVTSDSKPNPSNYSEYCTNTVSTGLNYSYEYSSGKVEQYGSIWKVTLFCKCKN